MRRTFGRQENGITDNLDHTQEDHFHLKPHRSVMVLKKKTPSLLLFLIEENRILKIKAPSGIAPNTRVAAPVATGGPACASPPPPTSVPTAAPAGSHTHAAQGHREGKRGRGLLTRPGRPEARGRRRRGSGEVSLLPALRAHVGLMQLKDRALGRVSAAQTRAQAWEPGLHPLAGTTQRLGSTWRGES